MKICTALALMMTAFHARAAETALRFVERATSDTVSVHAGKAADNVGDILTFTNDVFDAANKMKRGTDQGYCVRLVAGKAWECHFTVILAGGQLSVDGPFLDAGDTTLAVSGGTGIYSDARGEMRLHARDSKGTAFDFTFHLK